MMNSECMRLVKVCSVYPDGSNELMCEGVRLVEMCVE